MATERDIIFERPCKCGRGIFRVDLCNPDHGWPTSTPFWYETLIQCAVCAKEYELQQQGQNIVLVEKSEVHKKKMIAEESHKRESKLLNTSEVKNILNDFVSLLDSQKTMTDVHRLLTKSGLVSLAGPTFKKRWQGSESWVKQHISALNLPTVMKLLGVENKEIVEEVQRIEQISWESRKPPTSVGDPIYIAKNIA